MAPCAFHVYLFQGKARGANPHNVRCKRDNRNSMTRIILLLSFLFVACGNEQTSSQTADKLPQTDTSRVQKKDSIVAPILKAGLPGQKRNSKEIDKIVSDIDEAVKKGEYRVEDIYGLNGEPCGIQRYYKDSTLIMISFGCGDCSNYLFEENYYFKDNCLICLKIYHVDHGYNPCWTKEDRKEYGITEKFIKDNLKERNEKYYFLDSLNYSYKRTGNLNESTYVTNDTLSPAILLNDAIEYLNAKEPK